MELGGEELDMGEHMIQGAIVNHDLSRNLSSRTDVRLAVAEYANNEGHAPSFIVLTYFLKRTFVEVGWPDKPLINHVTNWPQSFLRQTCRHDMADHPITKWKVKALHPCLAESLGTWCVLK